MIKHEVVHEYLHVFYRNDYDYYPISLFELGDKVNWRVAECRAEKIVIEDVSRWTMNLMSDKNLSLEFAKEFQEIVKKYSPDNDIDWNKTNLAIEIYEEFRQLRSKVEKDLESDSIIKGFNANAIIEIIKRLKIKYKLD